MLILGAEQPLCPPTLLPNCFCVSRTLTHSPLRPVAGEERSGELGAPSDHTRGPTK